MNRYNFTIFMAGLLTGLILFGIIPAIISVKTLEEKCIKGAINQAKSDAKDLGYPYFAMPVETIQWCKDNF